MLIVVRVCIFQDITGWGENDRGVSYTFGRDVVHDFLHRHRLSLIARAHQVSAPHLYTVSPVVYACHNKNGGINIAQRMLERKLNFLGHMRDARWEADKTSCFWHNEWQNKRERPKRRWTDDRVDWCVIFAPCTDWRWTGWNTLWNMSWTPTGIETTHDGARERAREIERLCVYLKFTLMNN